MCASALRRNAFATVVFKNDSYVPGALVLAHSLREQETRADLIVFVTNDVTPTARDALARLYDHVIVVPALERREHCEQGRQYLSQVLTRLHALRLGGDGDLGYAYEKVVLIDADVLPLRCYDHLFLVDGPAGILNERAELFREADSHRRYITPSSINHGRWRWHHQYRKWPHGSPIPQRITDRVLADPSNYGVNTAVLILEPSFNEFDAMARALLYRTGAAQHLEAFRWPDMQFLTAWYSGRWRNIDLCFAGLGGYPDPRVLFGTHFAGPKPWQINHETVIRRFARFPDFQLWYAEFLELLSAHPELRRWRKIARLEAFVRDHSVTERLA